jgi:diadenosine tetraphosphatase ApaH/serine/threonine PP2A family protein phosphatase
MRLAILSDIHGNLEALEAVLADLDGQGVDRTACLGDVVGYGPDPEAVVGLVRGRGLASVLGNHELGLTDVRQRRWFNPPTRESLRITRALLSEESLAWLAGLPRSLVVEGCRLVHGFPPESAVTYLFEVGDAQLEAEMARLAEEVCFVGHTHLLELVSLDKDGLRRRTLKDDTANLAAGGRHLINAGAVGQPRDGDNRAKYVIWDDRTRELTVRRLCYDVGATAAKIVARGLPEINARRLW